MMRGDLKDLASESIGQAAEKGFLVLGEGHGEHPLYLFERIGCMRLNPDCIRDVLLMGGTYGLWKSWLVSESLPGRLLPYLYEEAVYHVRNAAKKVCLRWRRTSLTEPS